MPISRQFAGLPLTVEDRAAVLDAARVRAEHLPVERVVLYGSKARGDDQPDSDIDLLILTTRPLTDTEGFAVVDLLHLLTAVFLQEGLTLKRYAALRSALHERLIQTGRLDRCWGSIFDRLAELRTKSVYAALFALDPATGRGVVDDAARLAAELRRLLPPAADQRRS